MARRKKGDPVSGWICLDKPLDLTSTHAVSRVRRLFNAQKAGHAGTLDPLATGVLPIALGEATKTVPFLMDADKTYRFTIHWGESTATFDREGATRVDLRVEAGALAGVKAALERSMNEPYVLASPADIAVSLRASSAAFHFSVNEIRYHSMCGRKVR